MTQSVENKPPFMRWAEVTADTTLGRQFIASLIKQGRFPAPTRLGHRTVVFDRQAVEAWIRSHAAA